SGEASVRVRLGREIDEPREPTAGDVVAIEPTRPNWGHSIEGDLIAVGRDLGAVGDTEELVRQSRQRDHGAAHADIHQRVVSRGATPGCRNEVAAVGKETRGSEGPRAGANDPLEIGSVDVDSTQERR